MRRCGKTCWMQALIRDLKAKLEELSETPANLQRLVFRGHMLKDEQSLSHHSKLSPTVPCKRMCRERTKPQV